MPPALRRLAPLLLLCAACASPPPPPAALQEVERHLRVGSEHYRAGRLPDARAAFRRAGLAAERIDDSPRLVSALLAQGASELLLDHAEAAAASYRRAAGEVRRASPLALADGPTAPLASLALQARAGLAEATRRRGQPREAAALFRDLLATPGLPPALRLQLHNGLALSLLADGDLPGAAGLLAPLANAAPAAASDAPAALRAATLANLARLRLAQGDAKAAEALAEQALALDRSELSPPAIAADHALLGDIQRRAGRPGEARHHLERAASIYAQTGQDSARAGVVKQLGGLP